MPRLPGHGQRPPRRPRLPTHHHPRRRNHNPIRRSPTHNLLVRSRGGCGSRGGRGSRGGAGAEGLSGCCGGGVGRRGLRLRWRRGMRGLRFLLWITGGGLEGSTTGSCRWSLLLGGRIGCSMGGRCSPSSGTGSSAIRGSRTCPTLRCGQSKVSGSGLRPGRQTPAAGNRSPIDAQSVVLALAPTIASFRSLVGIFQASTRRCRAGVSRRASGSPSADRVLVAGTGPFLLPVAESLVGVGARRRRAPRGQHADNRPQGLVQRSAGCPEQTPRSRRVRRVARPPSHSAPARVDGDRRARHRPRRGSHDRPPGQRLASDPRQRTASGSRRRLRRLRLHCRTWSSPSLPAARSPPAPTAARRWPSTTDQQTSTPGVFAAGELTGIGGAALATAEGTLAGTAAAHQSSPDLKRLELRCSGSC